MDSSESFLRCKHLLVSRILRRFFNFVLSFKLVCLPNLSLFVTEQNSFRFVLALVFVFDNPYRVKAPSTRSLNEQAMEETMNHSEEMTLRGDKRHQNECEHVMVQMKHFAVLFLSLSVPLNSAYQK